MSEISIKIKVTAEKIKILKENLKLSLAYWNDIEKIYLTLFIIGSILAIFHRAIISKWDNYSYKLHMHQLSTQEKRYKFCQSCGKRFTSIIKQGREKNGEVNWAYCYECYDNGIFKDPLLTINQFHKNVNEIVSKQKGYFNKKRLRKRLLNLERWRLNQYI